MICAEGISGEEKLNRRFAVRLMFTLLMVSVLGLDITVRSAKPSDSHIGENNGNGSSNEFQVAAHRA